jgi:predicted transcriptional regulator
MKVINPFAEMLALPQSVFKPLRTNSHYLHFIETVTFYHQWQREVYVNQHTGVQHIETTIEDIEQANHLLKDVLLAKSDELTKATRRFLDLLKIYTKREKKDSFYSGEIRKSYRVSPATVKRQLSTLVKYGYVRIAGGSKSKGYEYELVNEAENLRSNLENTLDKTLEKIKVWLSGSSVAHNGKRATKATVSQ